MQRKFPWLSLWMQPASVRPRWSSKPWASSRETFNQNASSETRVMIATPLDQTLAELGIDMISPHRSNRRPENLTQDGRPLRRYRRRWIVERIGPFKEPFAASRVTKSSIDFSRLIVAILA